MFKVSLMGVMVGLVQLIENETWDSVLPYDKLYSVQLSIYLLFLLRANHTSPLLLLVHLKFFTQYRLFPTREKHYSTDYV